jgi:hypothetical protein
MELHSPPQSLLMARRTPTRGALFKSAGTGFLCGPVTTLDGQIARKPHEAHQATAGLHFTFGALAVASQFMPAFSHAD